MTELRIEWMPLDDLVPAKRNSRTHDLDGLTEAVEELGFTTELKMDELTGELLAGHGRLATLRRMRDAGQPVPEGIRTAGGDWLAPVVRGWSSRDVRHGERVREADNRQHDRGGYDAAIALDILGDFAADDQLRGVGVGSEELDRLADLANRTDLTELGTVLIPGDNDLPAGATRERGSDEQWKDGDDPDEGSTREEPPGPLDVEPAWRTIEPLRARYHDGTPDGADAVARWLKTHATDVHVAPDLSVTWRGGDGTDYLPPGKWVTRYRGAFQVLTREEFDDEFVPANEPARRAGRDAAPVASKKKQPAEPTAANVLRFGRGLVRGPQDAVASLAHTGDHDD